MWRKKIQPYSAHAKFCASWVQERPCLDVGCGDGLITYMLGDGAEGIDTDPLAVKLARAHSVEAMVGSAENLPFPDGYFAAVFMGDVIEHLKDPIPAIKEAFRVIGPAGMLYVSTPPKSTKLRPYHYHEYDPKELTELLESNGFRLLDKIIVKPDWVEMYGKFIKVCA